MSMETASSDVSSVQFAVPGSQVYDDTYVKERERVDSNTLRQNLPLLFRDNKRIVYDIICPPRKPWVCLMEYTRHGGVPLRTHFPVEETTETLFLDTPYDYDPTGGVSSLVTLEWHVNFADPGLFRYCYSKLYAQDEMQVMEHPALAFLQDYLEAKGGPPMTVDDNGNPTPCLIRNVERHGYVLTDPDPAQSRPYGLYGNNFSRASAEAVKKAVRIVDPPTISNIVAMAALHGGRGVYSEKQINHTLTTAHMAFAAARHETIRWAKSQLEQSGDSSGESVEAGTVIHTGNWGTGVFGGNKVLMALLQLIAAEMAGINRLVFHSPGGGNHFTEAKQILAELRHELKDNSGFISTNELINRILQRRFQWGVGDGN